MGKAKAAAPLQIELFLPVFRGDHCARYNVGHYVLADPLREIINNAVNDLIPVTPVSFKSQVGNRAYNKQALASFRCTLGIVPGDDIYVIVGFLQSPGLLKTLSAYSLKLSPG